MIKTFRACIAGVFLLVVAACSQTQPTGPSPRPEAGPTSPTPQAVVADLNVMSFNIRYGTANDGEDRWEKRRGLVMDVIRASSPDVLGLQEALRFQIDEIRKEFPEYAEVGVGRDDGKTKGEYSAVLYRTPRLKLAGEGPMYSGTFWFSDTPEKVASKTWGNGITRICSWCVLVDATSGKRFAVYNLHLDHQSEPSRQKSGELLANRLVDRSPDAKVPTIVTGDFNCGEDSFAIGVLTGSKPLRRPEGSHREGAGDLRITDGPEMRVGPELVDTFRVVHPMEANVRTFHAFKGVTDTTGKGGPQGALTEKIDFVLVDDKWTVLEAAIDRTSREGRYPSDHFPVTAKVRLR